MKFLEIPIDLLIVNPSNDRHGPTPSEETAIFWLFENKAKEMKNLARRIAKAGRVFDSPLVIKFENKYLVKDGNRRVTCLKLLHNPKQAPPRFQRFFEELREEFDILPPRKITCQVEKSHNLADEIVGLRHNGSQEGEGQLTWGTREKANHANRTSGKSDYSWSQKVERFLEFEGFAKEARTIKRSTLDKILDTNRRRERLGLLTDKDGLLKSKKSDEALLKLLLKLVSDMNNGELTLKNLLTSKDKNNYLDSLSANGFISDEANITNNKSKDTTNNASRKKNTRSSQQAIQDTLIKRHVNYDFNWTEGQSKISLAWDQLQFQLEFDRHKLAIAVVFRTLLDLTEQNYRNKNSTTDKGSLAKNLKCVGEKLVAD